MSSIHAAAHAAMIAPRHAVTRRERSSLHEGVLAGLVAAASVAFVFVGQDLVVGDPIRTAAQLGHGLTAILGAGASLSAPLLALLYATFHVGAFVAFGIVAAATTRLARREPGVLAGTLLLFAVLEVAYMGALAIARFTTVTGALAWDEMLVGNLVGAVSLGAVLWRGHPELRGEAAIALGGAEA